MQRCNYLKTIPELFHTQYNVTVNYIRHISTPLQCHIRLHQCHFKSNVVSREYALIYFKKNAASYEHTAKPVQTQMQLHITMHHI